MLGARDEIAESGWVQRAVFGIGEDEVQDRDRRVRVRTEMREEGAVVVRGRTRSHFRSWC